MVRHRRPVRGGKQRFNKTDQDRLKKSKPKKGKFDIKTASYVKERQLKNEEIEKRRRRLEEEQKLKRKRVEERQDASSDEENDQETDTDFMASLLSTFKTEGKRLEAIESSDEDESEEEIKERDKSDENEDENLLNSEDERKNDEKSCDEIEGEVDIEIEEENEEDIVTEKEDAGEVKDPFSLHLKNDLSEGLLSAVSTSPVDYNVHKLHWPNLGNIVCMIPKSEEKQTKKPKLTILEDKTYATPGKVPDRIHKVDFNKLHIKSQIINNLSRANFNNIKDNVSTTNPSPLTSLQKELFSIINNYQDLLFMQRTFDNADEIRFLYCLHAVNHVLKTRTKILHHNAKLQKMKKQAHLVPDEYRDQGLVRPKVLIIVPFKNACLQIVQTLVNILIGEDKGGSVVNKNRFMDEFSGNELYLPKRKPKPEDYEMTFKGNVEDNFKIGISVTKKTLKLYSNFYQSDIIISSPLGLRVLIGAEGEENSDYDFLASIELLVLDQSELFLMQNWDHVVHLFEHLHLQPKSAHETDFSRVRSWCAAGLTKFYRQTLVFSSLQLPEIHSVFNKQCMNYAGKVKVTNKISTGSVSQTIVQVPIHFHRLKASSPSQLIDARLEFFKKQILPHYRDTIMNHTLIFVPSYYDFVTLRNFMKEEELSLAQICEYTKDGRVAKARDRFFHSDAHFMLYSERAHFFHRRMIKGIRHLIFYGPPINPNFFSEMCNLMQESYQNPKAGSESNMSVVVMYSSYDVLQLSAVVGSDRAEKMVQSDKDVHMIMIKG